MTKIFKAASVSVALTDAENRESDYFRPLCPKCEGTYMHQGAVRIFTRDREDAKTGSLVMSDGFHTMSNAKADMDNNPSRRRDGLSIEMACETCGPVGRLTVYQHKGETLIGWQQ
jgi:hypothetical protein